ncbi:uncharacterized protein LOC142985404 isoform X2 [Anticarsia gemmatalis]|uniref:uncharacterized protein LOC142985404 isoform X2 n=1 Tax=Anticarsia gemmatalis TaxID=129554 RepID=UPI003F757B35
MEQSARKRSRKTKLVPRACSENDFDNKNMQKRKRPPPKKKVPENEAPATETQRPESPDTPDTPDQPREFSVTVAVAELDENGKPIKEESSDEEKEPEGENKEENSTVEETKTYIIDRIRLLETLQSIETTTTNEADKTLCIEVKNTIGLVNKSTKNYIEDMIQTVLENWQGWQQLLTNSLRSHPLMYKCYICAKAWWHLNDFREHITGHNRLMLDLEEYTLYEANMIASTSIVRARSIKDFEIEGNCPKCCKSFNVHALKNRENHMYECKVIGCRLMFGTCYSLREHEYKCHTIFQLTGTALTVFQWKKSCEICSVQFHTHETYQEHMVLMHTVRSDIVMETRSIRCQSCHGKYIHKVQHVCPKKGAYVECSSCYKTFSQRFLLSFHKKMNNKPYMCSMCSVCVTNLCQKAEHCLTHSDKFVMMSRCLICEEITVFPDKKSAMAHEGQMKHCEKEKENFYDKIIIPKSCLKTDVIITEEPEEKFVEVGYIKEEPLSPDSPRLEIKEEYFDDFQDTQSEIVIKQELEIEDTEIQYPKYYPPSFYDHQYTMKMVPPSDRSAVFGIKMEPEEITTQELQESQDLDSHESEFEEDIIRLDFGDHNTQDNSQELQESQESHSSKTIKPPKSYSCIRCGFIGKHKEFMAHLKIDCDGERAKEIYKCSKCLVTFDSFKNYVAHLHTHGIKERSCPECFRTFDDYETLSPHVYMHIKMSFVKLRLLTENSSSTLQRFQCRVCKGIVEKCYFFKHWDGHLSFEKRQDELDPEIIDPTAVEIKSDMLKTVINCLQSPEFAYLLRPGCIVCDRPFQRRNDCKRHLIEHLLNDAYSKKPLYRGLKCQICPEIFPNQYKYKKHLRDHASLPIYECLICNKTFSDSSNYAKHKKLHNTNAYTCDLCGKKFQVKVSIEKHMQIHQNTDPIPCPFCDKIFYLTSSYNKHIKKLHQKPLQKYPCNICQKKFDCLRDKWDHLWLHHQERKYEADCKICFKSFRRFVDLKRHVKLSHQMYLSRKNGVITLVNKDRVVSVP